MESYLLLRTFTSVDSTPKIQNKLPPIRIEIGRYLRPPLPAQERICLFCNDGSIEDAKHFMLSCTLYSNMPAYIVFLDTCKETIHNFQYLSTESKFNHVMRSTDHKLIYHLANFTYLGCTEPCISFVLCDK